VFCKKFTISGGVDPPNPLYVQKVTTRISASNEQSVHLWKGTALKCRKSDINWLSLHTDQQWRSSVYTCFKYHKAQTLLQAKHWIHSSV